MYFYFVCLSLPLLTIARPLSDKDKVTTSIVSNWFNNKRKDLKISRHLQGKILLMGTNFWSVQINVIFC